MAIFEIKDFCFTYPNGTEEALKNISLVLEEGGFYVICGRSGCGKSTLLRQMKPILAPEGKCRGTIQYRGRLLQELPAREQSQEIGFVFQNPDNQLVTDKVWHEMAFGLESLGMDSESIHLRVAEMASYFGIQGWFHRSVEELSGGQKQLLNLASVMVMHPRVLLLDEPAAQLAPVAAAELWQTLERIHKELGITVILAEHQLEEVAGYADKIFVMEKGRIAAGGTAAEIGQRLRQEHSDTYAAIYPALPAAMQIYVAAGGEGECPCNVAEGRRWLQERGMQPGEGASLKIDGETIARAGLSMGQESISKPGRKPALRLRNIWFRYKANAPDILKGLSLDVREGEIFALMGDNAAGKSTALKIMAGIYQAQGGHISINGKRLEGYDRETLYHGLLGVLPQEPASLFVKKTVREDLEAVISGTKKVLDLKEGVGAPSCVIGNVQQVMEMLKIGSLSGRHPFDLSGGEQQRVALAKVLLLQPRILLLDEPTKGLDAGFKKELGNILKKLSQEGVTIFLVSHDIDFCARFADRAGLFFDGSLVAVKETRAFFTGNQYYTTAANRIAGEYFPAAIFPEEVVEGIQSAKPAGRAEALGEEKVQAGETAEGKAGRTVQDTKSQQPRCKQRGIKQDTENGDTALLSGKFLAGYLLGLAIFLPLIIWAGQMHFTGRQYLLAGLALAFYGILPFFFMAGSRRMSVRRLVVLSAMAAIAVAGRAAFFMMPSVKPMAAVVIVAAASFGAESGFLVGCLTMLMSNMFFGQGPWTPWQMLAMGLLGLVAGLIFYRRDVWQRDRLQRRRWLCFYGFMAPVIIYGGIMNPASLLMSSMEITPMGLLGIYLSGLPLDLVHGATTVVFLAAVGRLVLDKLERVKQKYGLGN